jgi:hypothetical protein
MVMAFAVLAMVFFFGADLIAGFAVRTVLGLGQ